MPEINFDIHNIFNIFSSKELSILLKENNLYNYYETKQIHSTIVNIVDNNYQNNAEGDALITNKINTPLVIKTADCIPILLYDKENRVLGLVHSGWLGTLNNITKETIEIMINKFNCNSQNIEAYIYPSIRKCHFEVHYDVYSKFQEKISNIDKYTNKKEDKYYIDLQSIVKDNLKALNITNINDTNVCTCCHPESFHSYRYNHTDKRNYLIAYIKE